MTKRIICLILIVIWLSVIFVFSSGTGNSSNSLSKRLINKSILVYEKISGNDVNNEVIIKKLNYSIRKVAHFTIFLVLGIFIYLFINTFDISHKMLISILLSLSFAILDETHQLFVYERTSKIIDIFIDTLGSITSCSILNIIYYKKHNN